MNHLAAAKMLLVAESDLNRIRLVEDVAALGGSVRTLAATTGSLSTLAASAVALAVDLVAHRTPPAAGGGWIRGLLDGAGTLSSLWAAFRPQRP